MSMSKSVLSLCCVWMCSALLFQTVQCSVPSRQRHIMIFGGNGFMGAETVIRLLEQNDRVTLISRANWYWDSADRIRPYVEHVKCDRMVTLSKCEPFLIYVRKHGADNLYFDAIIDFSGYHPFEITDALHVFHGSVGRYIFISTDSVYEVSRTKQTQNAWSEDEAVRPDSQAEQNKLNSLDDYGHRKMECEEELAASFKHDHGPPYVSLRLPDVIGPRDNTYRWWIYQLWIKLHKHLRVAVAIPEHLKDRPISLVYVDDVADIIVKLVSEKDVSKLNQAYNLALAETPTLLDVLETIQLNLNLSNALTVSVNNASDAIFLYPSTTRGPISIEKATRELGWQPTSWVNVARNTVDFYENAISNQAFSRARHEVIQKIQMHLTVDPSSADIQLTVNDVYGLDNMQLNRKNEL